MNEEENYGDYDAFVATCKSLKDEVLGYERTAEFPQKGIFERLIGIRSYLIDHWKEMPGEERMDLSLLLGNVDGVIKTKTLELRSQDFAKLIQTEGGK